MSLQDAEHNADIDRIKRELDALFAAQGTALRDAVFVGMRGDEVKKYDHRLEEIKKLVSQLARLSRRGTEHTRAG
jgi:hypothetical protein